MKQKLTTLLNTLTRRTRGPRVASSGDNHPVRDWSYLLAATVTILFLLFGYSGWVFFETSAATEQHAAAVVTINREELRETLDAFAVQATALEELRREVPPTPSPGANVLYEDTTVSGAEDDVPEADALEYE